RARRCRGAEPAPPAPGGLRKHDQAAKPISMGQNSACGNPGGRASCGRGEKCLITVAMSKVIRSPRARVWRALVTPDELIRWDERRISLEAPIPDYPALGRPARWRCWLRSLTAEHSEEPLEGVPPAPLPAAVRPPGFERGR